MPLHHDDASNKSDETLAEEARAHAAASPAVQIVAEILTKLRAGNYGWWTPDKVRDQWSATDRLRWFKDRPDLRQQLTTKLTGLLPKAARNKQPDFQASIIDSSIDDGDVAVKDFDAAFDPLDMAVYGPTMDIWRFFRASLPWDKDLPQNQELVAWALDLLLASQSSKLGLRRRPVLTAHGLREAIPGRIWHTRVPLEVRVAIDEARFEKERRKPGEPFHAIYDLSIATPTVIAHNVPLTELGRIFDVAEQAMQRTQPDQGSKPANHSSRPDLPAADPVAIAAAQDGFAFDDDASGEPVRAKSR